MTTDNKINELIEILIDAANIFVPRETFDTTEMDNILYHLQQLKDFEVEE